MQERRLEDRRIIERIVVLETKQDDMRDDIAEIKSAVKELVTLANKGRGSLATILWAGGFAAAAVATFATVLGFFWGHK